MISRVCAAAFCVLIIAAAPAVQAGGDPLRVIRDSPPLEFTPMTPVEVSIKKLVGKIEWGKEQNGVRCAAVVPPHQQKIPAGEPLKLHLLTKNSSIKPIQVISEGHILFVYTFDVLGPDGKQTPHTALGQEQMRIAGD